MQTRRASRSVTACVLAVLFAAHATADEKAILAGIRDFFSAADAARRQEIARKIEADPAFERAKVSAWLHSAGLFKPLDPGHMDLTVALRDGTTRSVALRIPKNYDPARPWPLLYALHGSNGNGPQIIGYYEHLLGPDIENYVVAAPAGYADLIVHQAEWPPTGEHPAILLKVRQTVNIDSDRVFVTGYSLGGHTTWTLAVLYTDQFAGAMPLASTFTIILPDYFWESLVPNVRHLPMLCVWGEGDKFYGGERISPEGGIAGVNRELRKLVEKLALPVTMIELEGKDHYNVVPPADEVTRLLANKRVHWPKSFEHVFRHTVQAPAYWIEPHAWAGEQWTSKQRTVHLKKGETTESDEDVDKAVARTYREFLGRVAGEINGNELKVYRKRVKELTIWLGDGMIDWSQPVVVDTGSKSTWQGVVKPDLFVCLSQAARTWDFERLRWAGLRLKSGDSKLRPVDSQTLFPDPFEADTAPKSPGERKRS
jgi:poly(3-hydroxybutyrate) depolymerase